MSVYTKWEEIEQISDPIILKDHIKHEISEKEFMTNALLGLVDVTSFKTGTDFIQSMVKYFVEISGVHRAFITRRLGDTSDRLETLAFWDAHGFEKNFEYDMNGTPCARVFKEKKEIILNTDMKNTYPGCKIVMESYIGIPLFDPDKKVFGHFAIVDDKELEDPVKIGNLAFLFGSRVATEILRQNAYLKLEQKNTELSNTLELLQEMQKQVIHQEKMASLGSLTAGVAHEIKNPLNFVNNFSYLSQELIKELNTALLEESKDPVEEDIQEILSDLSMNMDLINKHGKRADDIVQRMLAHSRGQDNSPENTSINKLLEESYNLAFHSQRARDVDFNCELQLELDLDIPEILIFPLSLDRALRSIFENSFIAIKSKIEQGISAFTPKILISTTESKKDVVIQITDNGVGISQEILENIFDPFFTTKPQTNSIGLGLSISYDIICTEHDGRISVDSKKDEYTTITIELKK